MPTDILDPIETIETSEASPQRLFGDAGRPMRNRNQDPRYLQRLNEAAVLYRNALHGNRRDILAFQEALTTSDFPQLFGDILDRQLLARYREYPATYESYVRVSQVRDFRTVKRLALDGAEGELDQVAEKAPYPEAALSDTEDTYRVKKYGRKLHLTWEDLVNDDLDAFRDAPDRLARAARRSEMRFVTELFIDASGPHASLYTAPFANIVTGNPVLSITSLQTAMTVLHNQTDSDGEPIFFDAVTLVVPPALEVTAQNILNAIHLDVSENGGTTNSTVRAQNWMRGRVRLEVNPYIPIVATSNGATSWALFADPSDGRPALELGKLRGHAEPALFMKRPDAQRIGGTAGPDGDMADFDTDSAQWKVRHVFGGTRLTTTGGAKSTVASNGSGS